MPVIESNNSFIGWIRISDLKKGKEIGDVISPLTITLTVNAVLNEALSLMLSSGLKTLPIVDENNKLEGILTFDAIQEELHEAVQTGGS